MPRRFNTAGPCKADNHYMLPPVERISGLMRLIERQGYFVIHAPRQSGKTTTMAALAKQLTDEGRFAAVLVSCEVAGSLGDKLEQTELALLQAWWQQAQQDLPTALHPPKLKPGVAGVQIAHALIDWATVCPLPIVLLIDKVDVIHDRVLISLLHQLRANFPLRPKGFPQSLALIDQQDITNCGLPFGRGRYLEMRVPFNIKVASLTLENFTQAEIKQLYQQHTDQTGQAFLAEAVTEVFELTQGQPRLVNAIAAQVTDDLVLDRKIPITAVHVAQAKQSLSWH